MKYPMVIKLKMEKGKMSKRKQPDQKADNSQRPLMSLSTQLENSTTRGGQVLSWLLNKILLVQY